MHFWRRDEVEQGRSWRRVSVPEDGIGFTDAGEAFPLAPTRPRSACAMLSRYRERGAQKALLISRPDARLFVNGQRALPITVLRDRDELSLAGRTLVFAEAGEAAVVRVAAGADATCCSRCSMDLAPGDRVVFCPKCGAPHHEGLLGRADASEALACWSDGPACGGCLESRESLVWDPDEVLG